MSLAALAIQVGVTYVNLSILKNGRAKAIRFSTLSRLCEILDFQPGDLLAYCPSRFPPPVEHTDPPTRPATNGLTGRATSGSPIGSSVLPQAGQSTPTGT